MNRRLFLGMLLAGTSALIIEPFKYITKKVRKEKILVYEWTDKLGNYNFIQSEIPLRPNLSDGYTICHYAADSNVKIKAIIVVDDLTKTERLAHFPGMAESDARKFIKDKTGYEQCLTPPKD